MASIAHTGGPKPPPNRNITMESNPKTKAPCFLSINAAAQITTKRLTSDARIPVTKKLEISVKAGSPPYSQNLWAGPMEFITFPAVARLP